MRKIKSVSLVVLVITLIFDKVNAGPMKRLSRMVREVYPEIEPETDGNQAHVCIVGDVVYGVDETVPAEQPCLKCRCQPPGVQCETIQCIKKPGCKAIHRPNKCCPDYQCECEHNGKIYANGERLEVHPGGECKVCYCRGGEVQCAEVSCYIRKDCEGKRVPGTCCPKYDHCPPIDAVQDRPTHATDFTSLSVHREILDPWQVTPIPPNPNQTIISQPSVDIQDENKVPDTNDDEATAPTNPANNSHQYDVLVSKITIQEIIPERKEIPVTTPSKSKEHQGTLVIEESIRNPENNSNDLVSTDSDSETDSSEISEVFQHPPPVLRIGDKLLFLKRGELIPEKDTSTPSSVITIIGAEGLQRGFEESGEIHEVKIELPKSTGILESNTAGDFFSEINDLELKTSESTHILSLVKRKNKPFTTTSAPQATTELKSEVSTQEKITEKSANPMSENYVTTTESHYILISSPNTENPDIVSSSPEPVTENLNTSLEIINGSEEISLNINSAVNTTPITESTVKNTEPAAEQNPAYPPIPEIMAPDIDDASQQYEVNNENTTVDSKILPQVLEIRNNSSLPKNATHTEWLKDSHTKPLPQNQNQSLINFDPVLPQDLLIQKPPIDLDNVTEILVGGINKNGDNLIAENSTNLSSAFSIEPTSASQSETRLEEKLVLDDIITTEETSRSIESIYISEESGEHTTPKGDYASVISNENASLETLSKEGEVTDMIESDKNLENENTMESMEATTKNILHDVEIIDNVPIGTEKGTTAKPVSTDVEFINVEKMHKIRPTSVSQKTEATTYEHLPKPQELILSVRPLKKRDIRSDVETDDVFKDLDKELNADVTDRVLSTDEEQKESEDIFKELLEETTSPKPKKNPSQPRNRDAETLERVSNAFAQFALKGRIADSNILGVLSNFFSSQYRYNERK